MCCCRGLARLYAAIGHWPRDERCASDSGLRFSASRLDGRKSLPLWPQATSSGGNRQPPAGSGLPATGPRRALCADKSPLSRPSRYLAHALLVLSTDDAAPDNGAVQLHITRETIRMSQTREHELGQFIPLHYHHNMLNATVRMRGFKAALVHAVQPVQQAFEFEGYNVPTVLFQDPGVAQSRTRELAIPAVYQLLSYDNDLPLICESSGTIPIEQSGTLNALRFITKNILAIVVDRQETIDWHSQYLIVPLAQPLNVAAGDSIFLRFAYEAGASFAALTRSLRISHFRAAVAAHADHYWDLPALAKGTTALAAHAS